MRLKISFLCAAAVFFGTLNAQILLSQDFSGYDGSKPSVPAGWYFSWNSLSSPSCYNSAGYSGLTAPAYKLGIDQDTIITPLFSSSDSLSFWVKGSSTFSVDNILDVFGSADSSTWNLIASIDSLPQSEGILRFGIPNSVSYLKFIYSKVTGNLALDDIMVYKGLLTKLNNIQPKPIATIFPNPSKGDVYLQLDEFRGATLKVLNLLGKIVLTQAISQKETMLQLTRFSPGIYFLEIKTDAGIILKKIILSP